MYGSGKPDAAPAPPVPHDSASNHGRWTVAGGEVLFLAIEHQLDRCVRHLRKPRADQPFGAERQLAAEPAAHVLADDAHVGLRNG